MKLEITKTRLKYLFERVNKEELFVRMRNKGYEISLAYIKVVLNGQGKVPDGVTQKIRSIFEEAELMVKEGGK